MPLRPFFSFYGSKWRLAGRLPPPARRIIVEPFVGSAGYSLRYPDHQVQLWDLDPVICGVWEYLISVTPLEVLALPDLLAGQSVDDLQVCQEARHLIGFWLNKGNAYPCKTPGKWARDPKHQVRPCNFWGPGIRSRIAAQVPLIRHWTINHGSYEQIPDQDACWFVDPPYQGKPGKAYRCSNRGINFAQLGSWCLSRSGQVMVTEQAPACWLPFQPLGKVKSTKGYSREVAFIRK